MGEKKAASKTEYAVLVKADQHGGGDPGVGTLYEFIETVEETSSARAIRAVAEKHERAGEFVAPPARSFQPSTVRLERTPRAVVSGQTSR